MENKDKVREQVNKLILWYFPDEFIPTINAWLDDGGFFDAPASTKYHGSYPGGLAEHSLAVAKNLHKLTTSLGLKWGRKGSPFIVGLLHDVCKMDQYKQLPNGGYEFKRDSIFSHHGEKSICMLAPIIQLTPEEVACIRWHMGAYETDTNEWAYYGNAIDKYPSVLWTHTADMMASHIDKI